ncbi:MAG: response regulator [Candidatus Omnitrophica bacterium]|nr:response regulator [Candidatus Omnitrophota bacterium]
MKDKRLISTLVIEDDPFFVAYLRHYSDKMEEIALKIFYRVTLEEALSFLEENPKIELIILDYRIHSKITGLEILQHIRAKGFKMPIIIITASGDEEIAAALFKAGASDYLVKGRFSPKELERRIKEVFQSHERLSEIFNTTSILKDMALSSFLNGVCITDLRGGICYANKSFLEMWGYTNEEELKDRSLRELLSEPEKFDEILESLKEKNSWLGELIGIKKNGFKFYLQSLFSQIEYRENPQIIASFIDISKLKEEERKREELYRGIMEVFALSAEQVGNIETAGHIHRIFSFVKLIASKLRDNPSFKNYINEKYINDLSYASMLHDVGKWKTPNEILLKPFQLTEKEREIIKMHPKFGIELLSPILKDKGSNQYLKLVESVVLYHHENWDGSGYPEGLKGEEIPLSARIVSIVDTYDALTSDRSYRKAYTHEEAIEIMMKEKHRFDPRVWQVFIENHHEFKKIKEEIK